MPDPTPKDPASTASDGHMGAMADAVKTLANAVTALEKQGVSREAARTQVAEQAGLKREDLEKFINDADQAGNIGRGVIQVAETMATNLRAETLDREGRREVDALANTKEFQETFEKDGKTVFEQYEGDFHKWMQANNYNYGALSSRSKASELFRYFLINQTDYRSKHDDAIRKAEKATHPAPNPTAPTSPSLRPGAAPEGGIGPRLLAGVQLGEEGLSANQEAVMDAFGLSKDQKAHAAKVRATKTAMGTPIDFVTTKNEGGV